MIISASNGRMGSFRARFYSFKDLPQRHEGHYWDTKKCILRGGFVPLVPSWWKGIEVLLQRIRLALEKLQTESQEPVRENTLPLRVESSDHCTCAGHGAVV